MQNKIFKAGSRIKNKGRMSGFFFLAGATGGKAFLISNGFFHNSSLTLGAPKRFRNEGGILFIWEANIYGEIFMNRNQKKKKGA